MSEQSTEKPSSLQSVSESYRSRGSAFAEDVEDGVDTNQVQRQNASEHAGHERLEESVTPPAASIPNTVNPGAEFNAATTDAGEHQPDSGTEDPTVLSDGGDA